MVTSTKKFKIYIIDDLVINISLVFVFGHMYIITNLEPISRRRKVGPITIIGYFMKKNTKYLYKFFILFIFYLSYSRNI